MNPILTPMIITYTVVLALSTAFAGYLWFSFKHELLKLTFFLWSTIIFAFLSQGFFANLDLPCFLAYSTNIAPVFLLLILADRTFQGPALPIKRLVGVMAVGFTLSLLLYFFKISYAVYTFPFSLSLAIVLFFGAFYKPTTSPLEVGYKILLVATAFHYLDYSFLRPNPELALIGFSMGLVFAFCYSIIIPLFVMKIISDSHTNKLEEIVKHRTSLLNDAILNLSKVNTELETTNNQLSSVSTQNRTLLNVLVHDLSNPINVIMAAVKNIKMTALTDDNSKWVSMIDRAVWTIKNTISHVGTFHLTRFGTPSLQTVAVDLRKLFDSVKDDFRDDLAKKSLSLHVITKKEDEALLVIAEEQRLKYQIIGNLLSNAIKFSKTGSKIEITILKVDEWVKILVRDFGVGVPKEKIANLFNSDEPTSTFGTDGEKGMGLGLPIAKYFVKAMGGDVRHLNLDGQDSGCCFEVALKQASGS